MRLPAEKVLPAAVMEKLRAAAMVKLPAAVMAKLPAAVIVKLPANKVPPAAVIMKLPANKVPPAAVMASPGFPCRGQISELLSAHKTDELMRKQMRYILEGPPRKKMKRRDEMAPSIDVKKFKVASKEWVEESVERVLKYYRTTEEELFGRVMTPEDRAFFRSSPEGWGNSMKRRAEYLVEMKACVAEGEADVKMVEKLEALLCRLPITFPPAKGGELKEAWERFQDLKRLIIHLANKSRGKLETFLKHKLYPCSEV